MATEPDNPNISSAQQAFLVGYGKPPAEHRFPKGRSGNPLGRPPKARALSGQIPPSWAAAILAESHRLVSVVENGARKEITTMEATARKFASNLITAPPREQTQGLRFLADLEKQALEQKKAKVDQAIAYKQAHELARHRKHGAPLSEQIPHPDDILIDAAAGEVIYNGPADAIQKAEWDAALTSSKAAKAELFLLEEEQANSADPHLYQQFIEHLRRQIAYFERTYPSESDRRVPGFVLEKWRKRQKKMQRDRRIQKSTGKQTPQPE